MQRIQTNLLFLRLIIIFFLSSVSVRTLAANYSTDDDVKYFYHVKSCSGKDQNAFKIVKKKMVKYYLSSKKNYSTKKMFSRLQQIAKRLEKDPESYSIHALIIFDLVGRSNEELIITPIVHTLEHKLKKVKNKELLVHAENLIGIFYQNAGQVEASMKHRINALTYAKQIKDTINVQIIHYNIASAYFKANDFEKASEHLNQAIEYEKYGFKERHLLHVTAMALLLSDGQGKIEEAIAIYLQIESEIPKSERGDYYYNLATFYSETGKYQLMKKALIQSEKSYLKSGNSDQRDLLTLYAELSHCYLKLNDQTNAYKYLIIKDSIQAAQKREIHLAELERLKKEDEQKLRKLEKKQTAKKINNEQETSRRLILILLVSAAILAVITFYIFRLRKKNKSLVQMNIENMGKISNYATRDEGNQPVKRVLPDLIEKFEKLLHEKEIFKDPDLSVAMLSKKMGTNSKDLSQTINSHYGVPFRTLINRKRIDKAKFLLTDKKFKNYSMQGIAMTVGYANKSTFYKQFKELTGLTPLYFQEVATKFLKEDELNS